MNNMTINFNNEDYIAEYNEQSGYYEIELQAPETGGIYNANIRYSNILGQDIEDIQPIQIWVKDKIKIETNKVFMWIFDHRDFSVKDIVEISDYEINIDEETNANTLINVIKKTTAKAKDIVVVKKNNEVVYWGKIENIKNDDGKVLYKYILKYITNIFNQNVILQNEDIIRTTGIEDFIADSITNNFIENNDEFVNLDFLEINVKTHTPKQTVVTNVQNGIYNLHTWMTNCTQKYDVVYSFDIQNKKLVMTIETNEIGKELIDIHAQPISNYSEVFETDVVSKVIVLTSTNTYTLFLKTDRTTTTDSTDEERAEGRTEIVYTENYSDAPQKALDIMKANSYNHNITFNYYNRIIKVGTPIAIKTKESIIYDTYISAIKITPKKFIEYTCGNIRVKFIDKLLKERNK